MTWGFFISITNALRRIRNAWHFYHALILVIKVVCGSIVLRCSPLKRALYQFIVISSKSRHYRERLGFYILPYFKGKPKWK
ncbi:DUF3265 domain-containing protein [Vibrio vulnificus]|nr:DUF3265 domain-containing protein [Vibrio vulnificus]